MRNNIITYILFVVLAGIVMGESPAKEIYVDGGTRAISMGEAFTAAASGADALYWNPARIKNRRKYELIGNYSMLYSVDGLSCYSSAIAVNGNRLGNFGIGWSGISLKNIYSENLVIIGYSRDVLKDLSIGASVKTFLIYASGYEKYEDDKFATNKVVFTGDIGLSYVLMKNLIVAARVENINSPKISLISTTDEKDHLARNITTGMSLTIKKLLLISMDVKAKDSDLNNIEVNIGSEITFFNAMALRSGFSDGRLGLGLGVFSKLWSVDFGLVSHRTLGNKYQFTIKLRY